MRVAKIGRASGISVRGAVDSKRAFDQGYRFINIGHILAQGTVGLTADLKEVRRHAEKYSLDLAVPLVIRRTLATYEL
jgi:hypothetical protein